MHRHWTRRVSAALFGLWFCFVGFDTGTVDACPMQGMAQASQTDMRTGASTASGDASQSMPMGADSDQQANHGSGSGHEQQHQHAHRCPCCCCCPVALDVPPHHAYLAAAQALRTVPVARQSDAPEAWIDFILPFPTAPPAGQPA